MRDHDQHAIHAIGSEEPQGGALNVGHDDAGFGGCHKLEEATKVEVRGLEGDGGFDDLAGH